MTSRKRLIALLSLVLAVGGTAIVVLPGDASKDRSLNAPGPDAERVALENAGDAPDPSNTSEAVDSEAADLSTTTSTASTTSTTSTTIAPERCLARPLSICNGHLAVDGVVRPIVGVNAPGA